MRAKVSSSSSSNSSSNDRNLISRDSDNILDQHDIKLLDGYINNEILFKKIHYDIRKTIANKYAAN
jgi:hypothetical protein